MNSDVQTALFGHKVCGTLTYANKCAKNINKSKKGLDKLHKKAYNKLQK